MMIRFEDNIAQVKVSINGKQAKLLNTKDFLTGKLQPYKNQARNIVDEVVYSQPENPEFPRSMNTLNSVDTDLPEKDTLRIFLNPALATAGTRFPGLQSYASMNQWHPVFLEYYPAFVRRGIFFKKEMTGRDFLAVWNDKIGEQFKKDINEMVKATV